MLSNGSCQPEFCPEEKLSTFVESLNQKEQLSFNVLLRLGNQYPIIKPKQGTIAQFAGYARETVNRKIQEWVELGVLRKKYIYKQACEYTLNPLFFEYSFREKYSHMFSAFKTFALIYLFSFGKAHVFDNVTLISPVIKILYPRYGIPTSSVYKLTDSKRESRSVRNMYASEARKKVLLEITNRVGLTRRGQAALAPYPAECLEYVLDKLKFANVQNIRNIWFWFISLCNEWCKSNEIRPDFKAENDIIAQFSLKQDGPKIDPNFKVQVPVRQSAERYQQKDTSSRSVPLRPVKEWEKENVKEFSMYELLERQRKKAQKLREEGYQKEARALEAPITKEYPVQYATALSIARIAPKSVKEDWIRMLETDPDIISEPVREALREYQEGIIVSQPDNIFTEIAHRMTLRESVTGHIPVNVEKSTQPNPTYFELEDVEETIWMEIPGTTIP